MPNLHFLTQAVQEHDRLDIDDLLTAIQAMPEPPVAIVIDTRARCTVGLNENDATDQGQAISGVDRLRAETGAAVIEVHHSRRDTERERGSNAPRAASDTIVHCAADGDFLTIKVARQKDLEEGDVFTFRKRVVELPNGRTSLVLEHITEDERKRQPRTLVEMPESHRKVLQAIYAGGIRGAMQLAAAAEVSDRHIYRILKDLKEKALIEKKGFSVTKAGADLLHPPDYYGEEDDD